MSGTAKDRLIASTQALLWDRGYVGTSPKAIQAASGVGQGSMYHHFPSKPELAAAAIARSAEELRACAEAELRSPGPARERLVAYLRRERDVLRGCRIGRLAADPEVVADPVLRAPVEATFEWLLRIVSEVVAEGQADGSLPSTVAADDLAATIVAVLQGGYVLARAAGDPRPFERALQGALSLLGEAGGGR